MSVLLIFVAVLFGMSSVLMGAYIDHVMYDELTVKGIRALDKANLYHLLYSIWIFILVWIGFHERRGFVKKMIHISTCIMIISLVLFSGGIYGKYIFNIEWASQLAPHGGLGLACTWIFLGVGLLIKIKEI